MMFAQAAMAFLASGRVEMDVYFFRFGGFAAKTKEKDRLCFGRAEDRSNSFDVAASPQHQTKKIVTSLLPQAKKAIAA
jgi:hypothetical protein